MNKILVLFKTHLDVGFTDLSRNIVKKYNENYIPKAIQVAKELEEKGVKEGFIWTTGSWLIKQYLDVATKEEIAELDAAVKKGWISWHGLPFTTHTELMDKKLFEYGVNMAAELDKRYGTKTIGSKMTDVPGHTRAIVPILRKAGIEFLHIGVNPVSAAADVPNFFRWQAPTGEYINMMYSHGAYGDFAEIPGTGVGVYFAHTGDNLGPASTDGVIKVYKKLHAQFPEAEIVAASLNDVALAIREVENTLPVVTNEFGDNWIHGVGTDPKKVNIFKALERFAESADEKTREEIYKNIIMVPEHTWGVDIKTWLHDAQHWTRERLAEARQLDNFKFAEESWREQREYLYDAVKSISNPEMKAKATALLDEYRADVPAFDSMKKVDGEITLGGFDIKWDNIGIYELSKNGKNVASKDNKIGRFHYEIFGAYEIQQNFAGRYGKPEHVLSWWAPYDFMKPGLEEVLTEHYCCDGQINEAYTDGEKLYLNFSTEERAREEFGCPEQVVLVVEPKGDKVCFDLIWNNKPACRIPEALWIGFNPVKPVTGITKLGEAVNPLEVISGGNREMHATEGDVKFDYITVKAKDSALLAVGKPSVFGYYNKLPDVTKGVWFNLFNNQWGTNFPQWYEDDARFRFELTF